MDSRQCLENKFCLESINVNISIDKDYIDLYTYNSPLFPRINTTTDWAPWPWFFHLASLEMPSWNLQAERASNAANQPSYLLEAIETKMLASICVI